MTRVVAQGTFDLLHPGHVHYLRESAAMGDELYVIVSRNTNVTHKHEPIVPAGQRRALVGALDPVDRAVLGHPEDIFVPIEGIRPDVITLGHDQHHDERAIERALADRGIECTVHRTSACEPGNENAMLSTGTIIERICEERC